MEIFECLGAFDFFIIFFSGIVLCLFLFYEKNLLSYLKNKDCETEKEYERYIPAFWYLVKLRLNDSYYEEVRGLITVEVMADDEEDAFEEALTLMDNFEREDYELVEVYKISGPTL